MMHDVGTRNERDIALKYIYGFLIELALLFLTSSRLLFSSETRAATSLLYSAYKGKQRRN